jgi:hypothetical protein
VAEVIGGPQANKIKPHTDLNSRFEESGPFYYNSNKKREIKTKGALKQVLFSEPH